MPTPTTLNYPQPNMTAATPSALTAVKQAALLWADATTHVGTARRHDLVRDKVAAIVQFFTVSGKTPIEILPIDVKAWQGVLESQGLAPATVYARISRLSSFYDWLMRDPQLATTIHHNPVRLARPKAPKAYQTESAKALDDTSL